MFIADTMAFRQLVEPLYDRVKICYHVNWYVELFEK